MSNLVGSGVISPFLGGLKSRAYVSQFLRTIVVTLFLLLIFYVPEIHPASGGGLNDCAEQRLWCHVDSVLDSYFGHRWGEEVRYNVYGLDEGDTKKFIKESYKFSKYTDVSLYINRSKANKSDMVFVFFYNDELEFKKVLKDYLSGVEEKDQVLSLPMPKNKEFIFRRFFIENNRIKMLCLALLNSDYLNSFQANSIWYGSFLDTTKDSNYIVPSIFNRDYDPQLGVQEIDQRLLECVYQLRKETVGINKLKKMIYECLRKKWGHPTN